MFAFSTKFYISDRADTLAFIYTVKNLWNIQIIFPQLPFVNKK